MMRTVILVAISNREYADKLCNRLSIYSSNFYFYIIDDFVEFKKISNNSSIIECDICLTDNSKIAKLYAKKSILFTNMEVANNDYLSIADSMADSMADGIADGIVSVNFTISVQELFFCINSIFPNIRVNLPDSTDEIIYYIFSDFKCSGTSVVSIMIAKTLRFNYGYNTLIVKVTDSLMEKDYYNTPLSNGIGKLWSKMDYYIGQNKEINPFAFIFKDSIGLDWLVVSRKNFKKVIEKILDKGYERIVIDGGNELSFSSRYNIKIYNFNDMRCRLLIKNIENDHINVINRLPLSVDISREIANSDGKKSFFYINEDKSAFQFEKDYIKVSQGESFGLQIEKLIKEIEKGGESYGL